MGSVRERCGLVVGGKFYELNNLAGTEGEFLMDPVEVLAISKGREIGAIVHTHRWSPLPSRKDVEGMMVWRVPWVISSRGLVRGFRLVDTSVLELDVESLLSKEVYDLIVKLSQ
ncbi:hypothetical protein HS1genome_2291 [Sulfodiicoccus acidiphilus]|uniref:JAB domain-containing protein n=1 Tax=Sulfodiicoccus acidiphilus TaxID=1670455 RepID=A0A348B6V0_9CREN|nr:hypothetical protein HS1genome_2291 [Sulfodiicoccus acidiphilus]GGT95986.1 hypothetical protein GCM10007116_11860 [Sulfodiicoccus acidiphilus]